MKKIFFAFISVALFLASCSKVDLYVEQNPYRKIVEYLPSTFTMEAPGTITPDADYSWISASQSGNSITFTTRRNTTGVIREACFSIAGKSQKLYVWQRAHGLDVKLTAEIIEQSATSADMKCKISSECQDDYSGEWGYVLSKTDKYADGKEYTQSSKMVFGENKFSVSGLEVGVDYYVWVYAVSTEGDKVYSNMVALLPPVTVKAGDDLQAKIDEAKPYQTIYVQGGVTFKSPKGGFKLGGANANKSISGGWNADFTVQSWDNLTVIDGGKDRGFYCADGDQTPMNGYCEISYFEIINCAGEHGSAIFACGGPVTVSNCYCHDNEAVKGTIGTNEEGASADLTVVNCIVCNNTAAGHGAAFGFGDGKSDAEPTHAKVIGCLVYDNVSTKKDGYCSVFICYNCTELVLINNTIVSNYNWAEKKGPWGGITLRGGVSAFFANNIFAGNFTSPTTDEMIEPEYQRQDGFLDLSSSTSVLANNIIEGSLRGGQNWTLKDNVDFALGADLSAIMTSAYKPVGKAVGAGTLGTFSFKGGGIAPGTCDIKALLEKYSTDIAGRPRVVNGKVDIGCYSAQ